jgi:hypothetical protein
MPSLPVLAGSRVVRAVGADDAHELARGHLQVDPAQDAGPARPEPQARHLEPERACGCCHLRRLPQPPRFAVTVGAVWLSGSVLSTAGVKLVELTSVSLA